jgi:hypothetical protein
MPQPFMGCNLLEEVIMNFDRRYTLEELAVKSSAFRGEKVEVKYEDGVIVFVGNEHTFFPERPLTAVTTNNCSIVRVKLVEYPWGAQSIRETRGRLEHVGLGSYDDQKAIENLLIELKEVELC